MVFELFLKKMYAWSPLAFLDDTACVTDNLDDARLCFHEAIMGLARIGLCLNRDKCEVMRVGTNRQMPEPGRDEPLQIH